ncbi:MAG: endolytic transglycosylase MltG [Muribaculaceae bacterium]|nr:endolytic transglycosylase MltG [Muribaculaceae bacterium]
MKKKKADRPTRPGKANVGTRLRQRKLRVLIWATVAVAVCGVAIVMLRVSYRGEDAWVTVPSGSSNEAIADSLRSALGEREGARVYGMWRVMGGDADRAAGSYRVKRGQMSLTTAWRLRRGAQTPIRVSWQGVRNIEELAGRMARQLDFSRADFLAACDSILPKEGFAREEYAAAFMPDTYEFYHTTSAAVAVRRMLEYRNKFWNDKRTAKARELGLTPVEASTLASIVEEETGKWDEMPVVARLYLNRLERDMPLQADPTVKFAVGDASLRRITGKHLKVASPYNTYIHKGLPPGPIRIPSRKVIERVLDAPEHEFIYMCAREDFSGYHNFASSYSEHMANAARYQSELDKRGIH